MSQDQLILFLFKVAIIAVDICTLAFILVYTKLAPWWESVIGKTLVYKDLMLLLALIPTTLSLFLHFSRFTSHLAAWCDIATFFGIAGIMVWRICIWIKVHREDIDSHV